MKKKGVTRMRWRIREAQLNWKKNHIRRVARWKVGLLCFNSIAIVLFIAIFANFPEKGKTVSISIRFDEPTVMVKEVQAEETSQEKNSSIEEFDVETISNSEVNIIGEKVESTEVSQTEETQIMESETEKESVLETEETQTEETIIEELIAEHTICNPKSSANRNTNMAVAAQIINEATGGVDGYVLEPEEKFSWLEVVGNTTEEKGFEKAPVIKNRKTVQDLGGGVCQVSSAINSAIQQTEQQTDREHFYAQKHSLKSSYIKKERGDKEATVSFDSKVDFWFISTLEYPIRIQVLTDGGSVTVKIFKREIIPN